MERKVEDAFFSGACLSAAAFCRSFYVETTKKLSPIIKKERCVVCGTTRFVWCINKGVVGKCINFILFLFCNWRMEGGYENTHHTHTAAIHVIFSTR